MEISRGNFGWLPLLINESMDGQDYISGRPELEMGTLEDMADRTWNAVDISIWDEDWSELAIGIAIQIITNCPNQYGIYDLPLGSIKRYWRMLGQDAPAIKAAIEELMAADFIRIFGNGKVWIVKKFKRELHHLVNPKYRSGVASFIENYPEIKPDFEALYVSYYSGTSIKPVSNLLDISDSESDTELIQVSAAERSTLSEMKKWRGYKFDYQKSLNYLRTLTVDYPNIDMLDMAKTITAWLDDKPTMKGSHSRFRNFCKRDANSFPQTNGHYPDEPSPGPPIEHLHRKGDPDAVRRWQEEQRAKVKQ